MSHFEALAKSILISAGFFLFFLGIAYLIKAGMTRWGERLVQKTSTQVDDRILALLIRPVFYGILLYGLEVAVDHLHFTGDILKIVRGGIFIVGVGVVTYMVYRVIFTLLEWYGKRLQQRDETSYLVKEVIPLLRRLSALFIFTFGLIIVLKHFNYDVWSLVTALGVGSLAIGLAAKETLTNMISGFSILIDRPFRPGDRIELASGQIGDVQEIGLRSTRIKTFDHTILVVPNSSLVNASLVNYCYPDFKVKVRVKVGVAYGTDIEKAKKIMLDITRQVPAILQDPPPGVYFTDFGDFSLDLLMIFWVEEYTQAFEAKDRVNTMIHNRFAREGIDIPFPVQTVYLKK